MKFLAFCSLLLLGSASLAADSENIWYQYSSGLGADGYDVTSYFEESATEPERGLAKYSAEYDGLVWHFASAKNRDQFLAQPETYIPQYGGHCAYAAAKQSQAYGDPLAWTVKEKKLYFNFNNRVKQRWESSADRFIRIGDQYWTKLSRR